MEDGCPNKIFTGMTDLRPFLTMGILVFSACAPLCSLIAHAILHVLCSYHIVVCQMLAQNLLTFTPKWHLVDAKNQPAGRVAVQIAHILMGKHKPIFHPSGVRFVQVLNA
jgi:hypothetical protein